MGALNPLGVPALDPRHVEGCRVVADREVMIREHLPKHGVVAVSTPAVVTSGRARTTVAVLAVGIGAFGLLQSLIVPVLSQVQERFDTDQSTVTWVLTSYLLSAAVATPLIGRIGDAVGKQRMLVVTLSLLAVGSAMAALAPDASSG